MSSSWTCLLLKLTEMTSIQEFVNGGFHIHMQIPELTSLWVTASTLTAKKSMKMTFSSDKIYYVFLSRIQRLQIFKIPIEVIGILSFGCLNYSFV